MVETPQAALRVALMARDGERGEFRGLLEGAGIDVVMDKRFELPLTGDWRDAEVLLVDMEDHPERFQVERILQDSPLPVLLNAGGVGSSVVWHRRLVGKLQSLANREVCAEPTGNPRPRPDLHLVHHDSEPEAHWVVVLGASIGGPKAVARFLQALTPDLPLTILLGQHISASMQSLLVEQLDRCSAWPVGLLGDAQAMEPGHLWLVPADSRVEVDDKGVVHRSSEGWQSARRPDIDALAQSVAAAFGKRCGVIVFSGLGKDGAQGCRAVSRQGGFVWVQSAESCVIASMPEAARTHCKIELSGSPEELAEALAKRCQPVQATIN